MTQRPTYSQARGDFGGYLKRIIALGTFHERRFVNPCATELGSASLLAALEKNSLAPLRPPPLPPIIAVVAY
jgi:hypothetical protein